MTSTTGAVVDPPGGSAVSGTTNASRSGRRLDALAVAAAASLSAGAIHAAAIGAHAEHPRAMEVFTAVAAFQVAWGALALARRGKTVAIVGAVGNAVLFAGWVLAKWKGLSFVDGLDEVEPVQFADALCAALAAVSAVAASVAFVRTRPHPTRPGRVLAGAAVVVLAASSVPGMLEAGRHVHADGVQAVVVANGRAKTAGSAQAVAARPYDPSLPIDLGGVKGVTPHEQARAENLVAETVVRLPQWSSPAKAEAAGFHSIGDGLTGYEHFINWSYISDDKILDP